MSSRRSSGYNYPSCSQSQKMSIGMVVDLVNKPRSLSTKTANVSNKHAKREVPGRECAGRNIRQDFQSLSTINGCADHVQVGSAMVKIGQLTTGPQMNDNDHFDKQASKSSMIGFRDMQTSHLFNLSSSKAVLQPVIGVQIGDAVSRKEGKKDVGAESYGNLLCEDQQDARILAKSMLQEQPDEVKSRSKENLRMKLQEILGTIPSSNKKYDDSRTGEAVANELVQVQIDKGDARIKHRQNSDTIETDSEEPDDTTRKPMTRSQARKRVPAKTRSMNLKMISLSHDKEEHGYVFSLAEKFVPSKSCENNLLCLRPGKLDSGKRSCGIKAVDMIHHAADVFNSQQVISATKKLQPREELSLEGRMKPAQHGCLHENLAPEAAVQNKNLNYSPVIREKEEPQDAGGPISPNVSDLHISMSSQSPVHSDDDLSCPLFKSTKTVHVSSMSHDVHEFVQARKSAFQFNCSPAMELNTGSSDDAATPEETNDTIPGPWIDEKAKNGLFSHERKEFDSSDEVSSTNKVYSEDALTSPETIVVGKPMLFQTKLHCSNGVEHSNSSPTFLSNKSNSSPTLQSPNAYANANDELMEPLEGSPEDEFERVVSLLGLALERVKNKMMSMTNKRCSDILMSAAEEVHLKLFNVESQIQTDLVKLTSLNRTKRKRMETNLQGRQEQLKVIHEKFKKEIHQYIQDCRSAAEVLEAQDVELKGAIGRQKTSHGKLLLQAEEAVETQLNDAQRQIVSVHKLGKQKMLKLKVTIAECLKDGMSS